MCWISDVYLTGCSWIHLNLGLLQRLPMLCSHPMFSLSLGCWHSHLCPLAQHVSAPGLLTPFALSIWCCLWKGLWDRQRLCKQPRESWDQKASLEWSRLIFGEQGSGQETWKLYICKSMGLNGMQPWLLRELAGVIVRLLFVTCDWRRLMRTKRKEMLSWLYQGFWHS